MTYDIQVVFALNDLSEIELGCQNRLAIRVRSGQKVAERIDNTTSATSNDGVRIVSVRRTVIGGEIAPPVELVAGKNETSPFDSNMAH